ncbi:CoA pyrophosphatase [Sphingomonas sp.]|jgi:8-oxo-dGTP pyrophosphatase MutT (NUDIX family)|uniref:CoA pyrophosphatase n=1 Tax=Sphingomonas sp. TaxID=28214 RepID=UPI002EDB7148
MTLTHRLAAALTAGAGPPPLTGDDMPATEATIAAAVLIAITDRAEPGVILTRRTDTLRRHAGQVAFPGGRVDPEDADTVAAALREAHEEIALSPADVTIIGTTDRFRTGTGYDITPVVGVVPADLPLIPAEAEVAAVFEVPLAFLLDPTNHHAGTGEWQGRMRRFYEIPWPDHRIWGATAGIIVNLSHRLATR